MFEQERDFKLELAGKVIEVKGTWCRPHFHQSADDE